MNKITMTMKTTIFKLPTPLNISYWWNYGSLLSLFLIIQIISGMILSMHYCPNISLAFYSIIHIMQNISNGWLMHNIHMNGASFFFICMYIHISRGIYYSSYLLTHTWMLGVSIYLLSMMIAFLGYILPWGQMSYWGATVITNLVSSIPYVGINLTLWIWGGFSINNATLNRFFSLHFILPFMIIMMLILHLYFLHITGSNNPLGVNSNFNKIPFHLYFTMKDFLGFLIYLLIFSIIILQYPYLLSDPDNFTPANPLMTPPHIQPEWYFLFAYAILRSIPNKLGGVMTLLLSIMILYLLPLMNSKILYMTFNPLMQLSYWLFINNFILLTWMGKQPIEFPFIQISQFLSIMYFIFFIFLLPIYKIWNILLLK